MFYKKCLLRCFSCEKTKILLPKQQLLLQFRVFNCLIVLTLLIDDRRGGDHAMAYKGAARA
jgi:hypothetical protein